MRLSQWTLALLLVTSTPLVLTADTAERRTARAQVEFGIAVAQKGLWREAIYRWKRAIQIDPTYAAAYNNLAVAYEQEGRLQEAREAYEKALELDPRSAIIRKNYDLFLELDSRRSAAERPPPTGQ